MKSFVKYTLSQVVLLNVVFVLLVIAGAFSIFTVSVENMPPVDIGKVFVMTTYYGASAGDVEKLVTVKVEEALDGLENIEYIQSRSRRNTSTVEVKFIDDTDYKDIYDELRFRVQNAQKELPAEADEPRYLYIDTQVWMPVVAVNISGDLPNRSLVLLAEEFKRSASNITGVREVKLQGEYEKEFHVSLDPDKLRTLGVTFDEAARAVESASVKIPTGRLGGTETEYMLDAGQKPSSREAVLDMIIRRDGSRNFVRIRDVASSARLSHRDPEFINSVGGKDAVSLFINKEQSANALDIMKEVEALTDEFTAFHEKDGASVTLTNDSTIEIEDSVRTLGRSMILGMVLVIIVLWLTLGFRNAMLTAIGIPFSFLATLIFFKATGQSINTISLFSFVLVLGIIVDDAVIILENFYRHLQMGKSLKIAIVDGVAEVFLPVISSALTTVLAFMPMLIMTGSTGDFFSVIPKTVSFALLASLFEALFLLPVHILDWGPRSLEAETRNAETTDEEIGAHLESGRFALAWKLYYRGLNILLNNKIKAMAGLSLLFFTALIILGLSVTGVVPLLKIKFFPGSYFRYHVTVEMPPGTSIERTDGLVRKLASHIEGFGPKEAAAALGTAGMYEAENYQQHVGHHLGQVVVTLPRESQRDFKGVKDNDPLLYLDTVRDRIDAFIASYRKQTGISPFTKVFAENTGPPTGKAVNIRVTGDDPVKLDSASEELLSYLRKGKEFQDLVDLEINHPVEQNAAHFLPNDEKAYEYGLTPGAAASLAAGLLNGKRAGSYRVLDEEVDMLVRLAKVTDRPAPEGRAISRPSDILDIPAIEHPASPVYLGDIVTLKYKTEPSVLNRYNGKPALTISANIREGSQLSSSRVTHLAREFSKNFPDRHPGVTVGFGGEFETTQRTFTSLGFAFIIAILCIYMVLASQFKDYFQPLIILSAIAFAVIGVVYGMFLTRSTFTVGSFLAVVGLAGVAVNDSLILIDFINVRRKEGKKMRQAVLEACSTRMRPVLITTITTMFGLLPMAIGFPSKSIAWAPMATAFVTGLASATILALLFVPVEYELVESLRLFIRKLSGRPEKGGSYDN